MILGLRIMINNLNDRLKNCWKAYFALMHSNQKKQCNVRESDGKLLEIEIKDKLLDSKKVYFAKTDFTYDEKYLQTSDKLIEQYLDYKKYGDQNENFLIKRINNESMIINTRSIIEFIAEKEKIKKRELTEKCKKILALVLKIIRTTFCKAHSMFLDKKGFIVLKNITGNSFLKIADFIVMEIIKLAIKIHNMHFIQKPLGALKKTHSFVMAPIAKNNNVIS